MNVFDTGLQAVAANAVLNDKILDHFNSLAGEECGFPDKFYLTGFETIAFNRGKSFALNTVLNSVVRFEQEIVIVCDDVAKYDFVRSDLELKYYKVGFGDLDRLKELLYVNPSITTVLFAYDEENEMHRGFLRAVGDVCDGNRLDLIVDSDCASFSIDVLLEDSVSYFICCMPDDHSFVVAKRSRLVQTEGVSQQFMFDLYGYWQKGIETRAKVIEPMMI